METNHKIKNISAENGFKYKYCILKTIQDSPYQALAVLKQILPHVTYVQNTSNVHIVLSLFSCKFVKPKKGGCRSHMKEIWKQNRCHGNGTGCQVLVPTGTLVSRFGYITPIF